MTLLHVTLLSTVACKRHGLGIGLDEENWVTLIRETISVADNAWSIVLEGTLVDEAEDSLQLAVIFIPARDSENGSAGWQVTLTWGSHKTTVVTNKYSRANLPLLNVQASSILCDGPEFTTALDARTSCLSNFI